MSQMYGKFPNIPKGLAVKTKKDMPKTKTSSTDKSQRPLFAFLLVGYKNIV